MPRPIHYLTKEEQILFPQARKKFGFSTFFGTIFFGYALFGDGNTYAGIYRHTQYYNNRVWQKISFMWPTNPRSANQQAHRAIFANGVLAWQNLTDSQKFAWRKKGQKRMIGGYSAFMSDYLLSHF
jgi:hypothetical protein